MPKKQVITKSALVPTVLITGGAGFIGSHLAEALLENNARVIVIDNFKTGKKIYVKDLLTNKNFALYDADINIGLPPEIESVDYIFHLAGVEEYLYSKDFLDLDALFTNSLGTKNLLDLARKSSAKLLLVSTVDVYQGRISQLYLDRYFGVKSGDENKFSLIEAKRFAEAIVWEYFKTHDVDVRIVRLPEVYGPRMDLSSSGFLGGFIKNVLEGNSIEVFGEGTRKEYYLYISDVISGLVKAQFNQKTKGNIYSLVPEEPVSALETAYMVKSLADANLPVQFKPDISDFKPQVNTADTYNVKDLSWSPKVTMKEGIAKTLEGFGYSVNTHAFKPNKLVEQKIQEIDKKEASKEELVSLQGIVAEKIIPSVKAVTTPYVSELPEYKQSEKPIKVLQKEIIMPKRTILKPSSVFSSVGEKAKGIKFGIKGSVGYGASIAAIVIAGLLVFVVLPASTIYFNVLKAVTSLEKVQATVFQLNSDELMKETSTAMTGFRNARLSLRKMNWIFEVLRKDKQFTSYDKILGSLTLFSNAAYSAATAVKPVELVLNTLRPDSIGVLNPDSLVQAKFAISEAKNYLSLAEADLSGVDANMFPGKIKMKINDYQEYVGATKEALNSGFTVVSELPQILGVNGESKYIFWFQNSNEIRPTGGFIGSYGVLTLDKGKIKNFVIDDIYNPDGQIDIRKISVTPPDPIKTFLKENVLHLRNSNWDPDFPKSTKMFDDLYFKVTGETVDGYVALDLDFVKNILNVTGPVFLAPYNEDISSSNLYERAQYYSGFDYKEGSTDKKSFLTVLGSKLLEKLFALKRENYPQLMNEIGKSLDERHLMIYFTNNPLDELLKQKKWDGSLVDTTGDYLYVVNTNLGGTKANYYVKNKMTYEVNSLTRDGLLRANLYLDYTHTADDNAWPGGPYKDYVRVISQNGSKLTGAKIVYNSGSEIDIYKDIIISKEGNYNSFETSFEIDPKETARLLISYDLPVGLSITKDQGKYNLVWQKQPGTSSDEYYFIFNPPFGTKIGGKSDFLTIDNGSLKTNGIFTKDLDLSIILK